MKKATHNGTCQACGRQQANRASGLAHHGYTTEHGYFQGVCGGSYHAPLEESHGVLDQTVDVLRARVERLRKSQTVETVLVAGPLPATYRAEPHAKDVEHVHFSTEHNFRTRLGNDPQLQSHLRRSYYCHGDLAALWVAIAKRRAANQKSRADAFESHANMLEALKAERFGKELIERAQR